MAEAFSKTSDDEVLRYITATFPSVWALEVLLAIKQQQENCTQQGLVERLRASDLVVSSALGALEAVGLVKLADDTVLYAPANAATEASVMRTEELYRRRPRAVFRAIVGARRPAAAAFADAFKLRRS